MPDMQVVHVDGESPSEVHDMCVCSTLYHTSPNMPSTTGEYHNEGQRYQETDPCWPLMFHDLIARP